MTRQHFQAVARVIAAITSPGIRREACLDAIRELRQFNGNFDRYRFEKACDAEESLMPRWWRDKEAADLVSELDVTLEAVGLTPELKALLLQWRAEVVRLRVEAGADGRVEVAESEG